VGTILLGTAAYGKNSLFSLFSHLLPFARVSLNAGKTFPDPTFNEGMMRNLQCLWIMLFIGFAFTTTARAELGQQLTISGQTLQLNGSGTRSKTLIQIYESGLYLKAPNQNASEILEQDELMAIRIRITSGFVSRSSLVASLREGLVQSTGGQTDQIKSETEMFIQTLKEEVKKNDVYDFIHVPSKGLYIVKNGKVLGTIPGLAFKKALFGIWLSDSPIDHDLRQAMLSAPSVR